jgi:hypothetical protein
VEEFTHVKLSSEVLKGTDHLEDVGVLITVVKEIGWDVVDWMHLA